MRPLLILLLRLTATTGHDYVLARLDDILLIGELVSECQQLLGWRLIPRRVVVLVVLLLLNCCLAQVTRPMEVGPTAPQLLLLLRLFYEEVWTAMLRNRKSRPVQFPDPIRCLVETIHAAMLRVERSEELFRASCLVAFTD